MRPSPITIPPPRLPWRSRRRRRSQTASAFVNSSVTNSPAQAANTPAMQHPRPRVRAAEPTLQMSRRASPSTSPCLPSNGTWKFARRSTQAKANMHSSPIMRTKYTCAVPQPYTGALFHATFTRTSPAAQRIDPVTSKFAGALLGRPPRAHGVDARPVRALVAMEKQPAILIHLTLNPKQSNPQVALLHCFLIRVRHPPGAAINAARKVSKVSMASFLVRPHMKKLSA